VRESSVKQSNRKRILTILRNSQTVSIADISEQVQISKTTVKKVINYFLEIGLVVCVGKGLSSQDGGKKPELYKLNNNHGYVIALHIGPTFLYAGIMDLAMNTVHSTQHGFASVHADEAVQILADKVIEFLHLEWTQGKELKNIVIALPGIVNPNSGESVYSPHFPQWGTKYPFVKQFSRLIPVEVPVYIDGVNRLQAFAEQIKGKAIGKKNFIIVDAMEEGVGAGIIVDGRILYGTHYLSGEIGHMILDPDGPECICGGKGCFESIVSVKNVTRIMRSGFDAHRESLIYRGTKHGEVSIRELFKAAEELDPYAVMIIEDIASAFARGLNNVVMINDPQLIVIQGIYNQAGHVFLEKLRKAINQLSFPHLKRGVDLVYSSFGDERGAVGAGSYGVCKYFNLADYSSRRVEQVS